MKPTWILACIVISFGSGAYGCGAAAGGFGFGGPAGSALRGSFNKAGHLTMGLGKVLIPIGKCIYDEAEVRMADGTQRKVKNLEIGDQVLSFSTDNGIHASRMVGQLHNDNQTMVTIVEIQTSSGRKIPVTMQHSLFVRQCLSDEKWSPKAAQDVRVGDCVPRFHAKDGDVAEEAVVNIRNFQARGIRQPVTETGTIIVDDVVISCYDRVVDQDATHLALLPYRWLVKFSQSYSAHVKSVIPSVINAMGFGMSLF